ncbi:MAG: hypothetical protein JNL80_13065 [Phycisphaerae bacterium]|nr:hypothetical protein [Phycisphaerae bacterium]
MRFAGAFGQGGLHGLFLRPDGSRVEIAPLGTATPSAYVVRAVAPPLSPGACGMQDAMLSEEGGVASDAAPPVNQTCIAEMACDADFEYFTAQGSDVAAVVARVELVTNVMNLQYESDVGIAHRLTTILVRTEPGAPYTSNAHATLIGQFRQEWNVNQTAVERDVAQLFTGKELVGNVVGYAYGLGKICDVPNSYCLVQSDFDGTLACSTDLSAHELGHLWSATHCICVAPPSTMHLFILCANTFQSSPTAGQIIPFAESLDCLECVPVDCNGNGIGDADDIATGTSQDCNANNVPDECDLANGFTDCNGNGSLDVCESGGSPTNDCNRNGLPDVCDLVSGQSGDLDHNSIPDECDPDCNVNGFADGYDIQQGSSADCDEDGVPDECQIMDNPQLDCNGNGTLDGCEEASLPTLDCNGNGTLDICDIADGTSGDIDGNWVPDECDPDCNGNGIIDGYDVLVGFSPDCNGDRVPDDCQWHEGIAPPAAVNTDAGVDAVEDLTPSVTAVDPMSPIVVAAWRRTGGEWGNDGEVFAARSIDLGRTWSAPSAVVPTAATNIGGDLSIHTASLGDGVIAIIWSSTAKLNQPGATSFREIHIARSFDAGATWTAPTYVRADALSDIAPEQTPDLAGHPDEGTGRVAIAVWQSKTLPGTGGDGDIAVTRSVDGGATWTTPTPLHSNAVTDSLEDIEPRVAYGGQGRWLVVWQSRNPLSGESASDLDIHGTVSVDDGLTWGPVFAVNPSAESDGDRADSDAAVEGDGVGGFVMTWSSQGAIGSTLADRDVVARRRTGAGVWLPAAVISGDDTLDQGVPDLARDGSQWRIVWRMTGAANALHGSDLDLMTSASLDDGETWLPPAIVMADAATDGDRLEDRPALFGAAGAIAVLLESNGRLVAPAGVGSERDLWIVEIAGQDCNRNGIGDWCDIIGGTAPDEDRDGIPDSCQAVMLGDLDGDGTVAAPDLAILLGAWGATGGSADLNGDGTVGAADLALLLGAWD